MTDARTWAAPGSGTPPGDPPTAPEPATGPPQPAQPAQPAPADDDARHAGKDIDTDDEFETEIPLRPLGVSEILDGAITYIRRNPRATLGTSAVLTCVIEIIVTVAQYFVIGSQARTDVTPAVLARSLGSAFLIFLGEMVLTTYVVLLLGGLLAPVMARTLLGRHTSLRRARHVTRPRMPRLLGAATVVLAVVLLALVFPLTPMITAVLAGSPDDIQALTSVFGVPVGIAAMVSAYVWFAFTTPILVMERRGVIASLRRSAEIVRGRWWRTFGVLVLSLVIAILAGSFVLPMPFAVAQRAVLAADPEPTGWTLIGLVALGAVGRIIAGTLVNPFNAGVIAILYADRRMRREAFDLELQIDPPDDPLTAWLPGPLTAAGSGPQPKMPRGRPTPPPAPPPPYPPYPPHPPSGWSR